jgi:hypothetical protein
MKLGRENKKESGEKELKGRWRVAKEEGSKIGQVSKSVNVSFR